MTAPIAPRVRRFGKGDPENALAFWHPGRMLVSVDPGSEGAALLLPPPVRWTLNPRFPPPIAQWRLQGLTGIVDMARSLKMRLGHQEVTVLIEDSFGGGRLNIRSDLALAMARGAIIGALLTQLGPSFVTTVVVPPTTWQTTLGLTKRAKREERKAAARAITAHAFRNALAVSDGCADALAMAGWWVSQEPLKGPTPPVVQEGSDDA